MEKNIITINGKRYRYEYMNNETGELLSYDEMMKQAAEDYDLDDPTNGLCLSDYYQIIRFPVKA